METALLQKHFHPLTDLGFSILRDNEDCVMYLGNGIHVSVWHEYGGDLSVMLAAANDPSVSVAIVRPAPNNGLPGTSPGWWGNTQDGQAICFAEIINLLMENYLDILQGDSEKLRLLHDVNRENGRQFCLDQRHETRLFQAAQAWQNRQFSRYIELLGPIKSELSLLHQNRLSYALKHISSGA